VCLNDLLAKASVDPEREAELLACFGKLDRLAAVANEAGYAVTSEDFLALMELADDSLAATVGGV